MSDYLPSTDGLLAVDTAPAGELVVAAPFDRGEIARVPTHGGDAVDAALGIAHALFRDRDRWLPVHERVDILNRLVDSMGERHDELSLLAAREGGKPLTDSRAEVTRAIDGVQLAVETLRSEQGHAIPVATTAAGAGRLAVTRREPIGVVVAVSAFNHPLNLIVHQVAAAVAAGCPVVVKPAEDTPLSCFAFVGLLHEAGLPVAFAQALVTDSLEAAEQLVTDPRVAFFSFIGSAKVGWMLRSKLAPGTRAALEHGGAAPLIVAADADLDAALAAVLKGGYYHAGQVCVSVQRLYLERAIADAFIERLAAGAAALTVGDPTLDDTEVGPLIRPAEVDRIEAWVGEAIDAGARLATGGKRLSDTSYAPTLLVDPADDAKVSTEEIFGPVVCAYVYDDLDDAIERANALPVAFQAAVFSRDIDTAMRVFRRIDASAVMVNDHTAFRVDGMPFAGLKQSGLGVGGIPYTMHDMSIEKMLVVKSPELAG